MAIEKKWVFNTEMKFSSFFLDPSNNPEVAYLYYSCRYYNKNACSIF